MSTQSLGAKRVRAVLQHGSRAVLLAGLGACGAPETRTPAPAPPRPAPRLESHSPRTQMDEGEHVAAAPGGEEPPADPPATREGADPSVQVTGAQESGTGDADADRPGVGLEFVELGSVAGAPITTEDLLLGWYEVGGRELWLIVEKLVSVRLAFAEAQRLGIRLLPEDVEARVDAERTDLAAEAESLDLTVEDFVESRLGVEAPLYFERMRLAAIRQMLAERAVRSFSLGTENVDVRMIAVQDGAQIEALKAELIAGADFGELAERHSVDASAERGGLVQFIVRQEQAPLARLAFNTEVGELGGPISSSDHHFLIRVEERRAPLLGGLAHDRRSGRAVAARGAGRGLRVPVLEAGDGGPLPDRHAPAQGRPRHGALIGPGP